MSWLSERLRRWTVGQLARRRGEVRANQDFRFVGQVARLAAVFAVTMLLPIGFLAFLSLTSIRSEELSITADVEARARALSKAQRDVLADVFARFEAATLERLGAGIVPTDNLGELSPHLRAAFVFRADGEEPNRKPEAPFVLGQDRPTPRPPVGWRTAARLARQLESASAFEPAAQAWREARGTTRDPVYTSEATLGEARCLAQLGRAEDAQRLLADLFADAGLVRDSKGFLVLHLIKLELSAWRPPDDVAAQTELEGLVDDILSASWTIGARPDSPGVWAIVRVDERFYAFSFSVESLVGELVASVQRVNDAEPELAAHLEPLAAGSQIPHFGPWLPSLGVVVEPRDPKALATSVARRRAVRLAIVATAVFVAGVGAVWVARMVALEVENARQRADFAANVSHELRSPITQIRLKGEALQLGLVDPGDDMQQHFDAIVREAERLSKLVDNVLDFAAIERGTKSYHLRRDDLGAVVAMAVETARPALEQAGMAVEVELPRDLPPVDMDRDAMGQVLVNLLSNAVKYAADGKWVQVAVRALEGGIVELSVADRGMGISAEELPRVFDDFFRSSDPRVRRTKGTGIGLAIVRYIVEAHGGTITVTSAPGRGATFTVTLPTPGSTTTEERS